LLEVRRLKVDSLRALRDGNFAAAIKAAGRCWTVSPDNDAARLLAVAHLLSGSYDTALEAYNIAARSIKN
jgi:hypothetical protein